MISRALLNAPFFILKDADLLRNRKVNTKKRQNRHLPELAFLILGTYFTAPILNFLQNPQGWFIIRLETEGFWCVQRLHNRKQIISLKIKRIKGYPLLA